MATIREIREGLEIFEKHLGPDYSIGGAEHDILYVAPEDEDKLQLTEEEKQKLDDLGWHLSSEDFGWARFV